MLKVHNLGLDLADGRHLLTNADMTVKEGERVMLSGRSGSGKSTLLRAMGHLWPTGHGSIRLPSARYLFLPQKPYLPIGTLRDVLSYPQPGDTYPNERYAQVLETCRLPHLIARLDEANHWQRMLSPGEQQRLAFARALLYAPQWLYMDEATSAMDEEDEATLVSGADRRVAGAEHRQRRPSQQPEALPSAAHSYREWPSGGPGRDCMNTTIPVGASLLAMGLRYACS